MAAGAPLVLFGHLTACTIAAGAFASTGALAEASAALLVGAGLGLCGLLYRRLLRGHDLPRRHVPATAAFPILAALLLVSFAARAPDAMAQAAVLCGLGLSLIGLAGLPRAALGGGAAAGATGLALGLAWPLAAATTAMGAAAALLRLRPGAPAPAPDQAAPDVATIRLARFAGQFERSGLGWFWETDANGRLSYVSPPLAAQFGAAPDALIGRPVGELFADVAEDPAGILKTERTLAFYLSGRLPFTELTVRGAGDSESWWSLSAAPVTDAQGEFVGFRGFGADLSERKRAEAELWRMARYDSLTGLPNRSHMQRVLEGAVREAGGGREGCALFLLDLDRFKEVNDTQGHLAGDELLRQVAKRLSEVIARRGQIGRLGGDEFKIVLPRQSNAAALAELAERCLAYLAIPYRINGRTFSISASIGIAVHDPADRAPDEIVRRADLALYAAKDEGRGTFRFFQPEMQTVQQDRQVIEHDLKQAIAEGALELFFQPVVDTASEELSGFEALVRWDHPVQGYISPATFIPIAEEAGLIIPLGEWVIRTACREAARWPASVKVAVNLSPIQFASPNLSSVVMSALAHAGLPASRLELEVTEGIFLAQDPKTSDIFKQLKSIGVRLVLDDFGTGYSSFGYLRTAPFDKIKIDQSFVRGAAAAGSRNATILEAIVDMAEGLGMETTAEGAETQDELELVRRLGCSHVQGFVFGRPVPGEDAARIAGERASVSASGFAFSRQARQRLIRKGLLHVGQQAVPILVRNISEGGALIESPRAQAPGTSVRLEIAGCGVAQGEIRWTHHNRAGVKFDAPFALEALIPASGARPATEMLVPDYISGGEYLNKQRAAL